MKRLSKKEKGFVKDIVKGETGTQAVLNNYNTDNEKSAAAIASKELSKVKIQNAIEAALPDELLAKKHLEGLFATRGIYRQEDEYQWVKIDEEPDYAVIHRYLDSAYKIKGKYKDLNLSNPVFIQISGATAKKYGIDPSTGTNSQ